MSTKKKRILSLSILYGFEILTYFFCLGSFYLLFSLGFTQLRTINRTMIVTILTFSIVFLLLLRVYGRYDLNKRSRRMILMSLFLNCVMTDLITYFQLTIMNTNAYNNYQFEFAHWNYLFIVIPIQLVVILIMITIGHKIYYGITEAKAVCIIHNDDIFYEELLKTLNKMPRLYNVKYVALYQAPLLKDYIIDSDEIYIGDIPIENRKEIIEYCYYNQKSVHYIPGFADLVSIGGKVDLFDDLTTVIATHQDMDIYQRVIKRLIDIVGAIVGLILLFLVWIIIAIAIKIEDGGRVFYYQQRLTRDMKTFNIIKFRSMVENDDVSIARVNDERITKVGKFIRRFRIDETPQLINVLRGEMSLVGPRPESVYYFEKICDELPEFAYRTKVKAGLTGMAQIYGKYNTSPRKKLMLDLIYIEQFSLLLDVKLILQTPIAIAKSDSTEGIR